MNKDVLEASALKHLGRWHNTDIEEGLMKARAFISASGAFQPLSCGKNSYPVASCTGSPAN
jgi:hypothetical protein